MNLKFTFIYFCLILSVISLNLKKKNENKKSLNGITSFLQNKLGQSSNCKKSSYGLKIGERCSVGEQCIYNSCYQGYCVKFRELRKLKEECTCDYHCQSGHCSYHYWWGKTYYHCTKN